MSERNLQDAARGDNGEIKFEVRDERPNDLRPSHKNGGYRHLLDAIRDLPDEKVIERRKNDAGTVPASANPGASQ